MQPTIQLIYLDKRGDDDTNTGSWEYFRIGPSGVDTIEVCRVRFPSFEDKGDPIATPGNVGLAAAYDNVNWLLLKQWDVERERSILIGIRAI